MALEKQVINVPFQSGIDTKTHPWVIPAPRLTELENGVFTQVGAISPRDGFEALPQAGNDAANASLPIAVGTRKEELVLMSNGRLWSYAENLQTWVDKGLLAPIRLTAKNTVNNSYNQSEQSSCTTGAFELTAWEDSRGGIRFSIRDHVNDVLVISDAVLDGATDALRPSCVAFDGNLTVSWWRSGTINTAIINPASPTTPVINAYVNDAHTSDPVFDVALQSSFLAIVYKAIDETVSVVRVDTTFTLFSANNDPSILVGKQLSCAEGAIDQTWVACTGIDNNVHFYQLSYDSGFFGIDFQLTLDSSDAYRRPCLAFNTGTLEGIILWQSSSTDPTKHSVQAMDLVFNTATGFPSITPARTLLRSVGITSRPFYTSGSAYVALQHSSSQQSTTFLVDTSAGAVVGTVLETKATSIIGATGSKPSFVSDVGNNTFSFVSGKQNDLIFENVDTIELVIQNTVGSAQVYVDVANPAHPQSVESDGVLHVAAGQLYDYDGANVVEHGFHLWPEDPIYVASTGGDMDAGTYGYAFTYEWTDNQGHVHRSAPSVTDNVDVPANGKVTCTVPTLRLTQKQDVRIVGYRRPNNTAVFQRFTSVLHPTLNDTTVDSVTVVDTLSTDTIATNDVLYSEGGVLENMPIPRTERIVAHKNRVFVTTSDGTLFYSKLILPGEPVEFAQELSVPVPADGGDLVAIASLDDNLAIFRERSVYVLAGEGPTDVGTDSDYGVPSRIGSDVGCTDPESVTVGRDGAMFKSAKGIYTLQRGLSMEYTGAPVEALNGSDITGAVMVPDKNQFRFITDDNMIVYDYFSQNWSTFTGVDGSSSTVWKDKHAFARSDGRVMVERVGSTQDDGSDFRLRVTTGWLSLAGMQQQFRLYDALLLGDLSTLGDVTIDIAKDFNPGWDERLTFDSSLMLTTFYGDASPYGVESPYGGTWDLQQLRISPSWQKCQSVRFRITVLPGSSTKLLGLALSAAPRGMLNKFTSRKTAT